MSEPTESYFIRSDMLKRLVSGVKQLRSHADSTGNEALLSDAVAVQDFVREAEFYVGIPDESYPTMYRGKDLNLDAMDDRTTIRAQMKTGDLGRVAERTALTAERLKASGDEMAGTAELIFSILRATMGEKYHGKTHQVASFDAMGKRLGFYP